MWWLVTHIWRKLGKNLWTRPVPEFNYPISLLGDSHLWKVGQIIVELGLALQVILDVIDVVRKCLNWEVFRSFLLHLKKKIQIDLFSRQKLHNVLYLISILVLSYYYFLVKKVLRKMHSICFVLTIYMNLSEEWTHYYSIVLSMSSYK